MDNDSHIVPDRPAAIAVPGDTTAELDRRIIVYQLDGDEGDAALAGHGLGEGWLV